ADDRRAGAVFLPSIVPFIILRLPAGGSRGENLKARRSSIATRGHPAAAADLIFAAIALVSHDRVPAAKRIAGLQARAGEDPMPGALDRVAAGAFHELAVAHVISAEGKTHAGQVVLRPRDQPVAPERAELLVIAGFEGRVLLESVLPGGKRPAVVF